MQMLMDTMQDERTLFFSSMMLRNHTFVGVSSEDDEVMKLCFCFH